MGNISSSSDRGEVRAAFDSAVLAMMGMFGGEPFVVEDRFRDGTPIVVGGVDLGDGDGARPLFIMVTDEVAELFPDGVLSD